MHRPGDSDIASGNSDLPPEIVTFANLFAHPGVDDLPRPHAGIRRTGSGALMDWRGGGFSAYDLVHGVITAKATARVVIAQVVMRSRDSLDGP